MFKLIAHLRAQWAGFLALFLVIAGGTAYAANTIGSSDVVNNSLLSEDLKNNAAVKSVDVVDDTLSGGGLAASDLRAGSVGSSEVADGSIQNGDLAASVQGARAFGVVIGTGCGPAPGFCEIRHAKQVAYAAHVAQGKYCIGVNGVNATEPTAFALVTAPPNYWAYWAGAFTDNLACVGSEFEVYTGQGAGFQESNFSILIP
jgi:hypothetical protein